MSRKGIIEMYRRKPFFHVWVAMAFLGILLLEEAPVRAQFFKPHVPDFYQHQKAPPQINVESDDDIVADNFSHSAPRPTTVPSYNTEPNWWENRGGWCCVSAYVNSFYYMEKNFGYDGFFTRTGGENRTWQEQMIYATEDFANTLIELGTESIAQHIRRLERESRMKIASKGGKPPKPLSYKEYFRGALGDILVVEDDGTGTFGPPDFISSGLRSLFDVYRAELLRGEDVVLRLQFPTVGGSGDPWWHQFGTFHAVTGAGVGDRGSRTLWFADPDKRNADEAGTYLNLDVRMPYPNDPNLPVPVGEMHYERVVVDANDIIISGIYTGARIIRVAALSPIPEPSTLILFGVGTLGVIGFVLRHRKKAA